ncbi:MAG: hypothetical protein FJX59_00080 [Alphaproteobacteria bacterium]|nr:hypothetical protein [Alphaproteobacteria bacterium]
MNHGADKVRGWLSRAASGLLALGFLAACAVDSVTVVQNDPKNGDGIGGTGIKMADNRNGDGLGGTGILGTISGFGSIIVNGMELEYDRGTKVEIDGRPASLEDLKVGQVILGTARTKNGELYLDSIEMLHAVTGPIEAINHDTETMTILGQKIRLNLAGDGAAKESFKTLTIGDSVAVSGLRMEDGTIVATRVDQRPEDGRLIVRGIARGVSATSVTVGGLDIPIDAQTTISAVKDGGRVFASGRVIGGKFVPEVVIGSPALPFEAGVNNVSLEGYVPSAAGPTMMIEGVAVAGATLPAGTTGGDRIVVNGQVSGADRVTASTISRIKTVVTILRARGSMRPAAVRPNDPNRPERMQQPATPTPAPERPQRERPQRERPQIERPFDFTMPMV